MTKIISTHSFRGGTGKSNVTANVAVSLANKGFRVGVFDTDIQSPGIHVIFGLQDVEFTLNDFLWGNCAIKDAAYPVFNSNNGGAVYLVPSSIEPNDIARILREKYDASDMHKKRCSQLLLLTRSSLFCALTSKIFKGQALPSTWLVACACPRFIL